MKRLFAAIFDIAIIAALVTSVGPAHAADSTVTGAVSNGSSNLTNATVYFYATCDDYDIRNSADSASLVSGTYSVTVPDGTYRVLIEPGPGQGAALSWHNAKASCAQADPVTVSGNAVRSLVARSGYNVTGSVTSTNGSVSNGQLTFYASCRAYHDGYMAGFAFFSGGTYTITVPAGTYYARIVPNGPTGALTSWHGAQALCGNATAITISTNTSNKTLTARPGVQLSGTIRSSRGPIDNGSIQFFATCEDYEDNNSTAYVYPSGGTYSVTLPAGTYRVAITTFGNGDGALNSWHNASSSCAGATTVTVSGLTDTENLVARAAVIVTGSVTRAGGGTVTGGSVTFYTNCQAQQTGSASGYGYIDSGGGYRVAVPPGTYLVMISPLGSDAAPRSWHNGALTCAGAQAVNVPGDTTLNLVAAAGYAINGAVTSTTGPVPDGYVEFYAQCYDNPVESATIESGMYEISLSAGTYRVLITPTGPDQQSSSWHNAKASCETADPLTVTSSGRIDLVASGGARVSGHPTSANGPVSSGEVSFYATCEDYAADEPTAVGWINNQEYVVTVPNGTYRVRVSAWQPSNAITSWHNAKATCEEADVVTINGNQTFDPVAATGIHVTGAATTSAGPLTSGSVTFYPTCQDYEHWDHGTSTRIRDGQYSAWLPPGTYRALIQPRTDTAARSWHNAKASCANAEIIAVAGPATSQDLVASVGYDVTGLVMKGATAVAHGGVEFYATCQDLLAGQPADQSGVEDGLYTLTLAPGTYYARIRVSGRNGEKFSWHAATGTCGSATQVTVSGPTTANLQARTTSTVSGTVTSSSGQVDWGWLEFYATCQDYLERNLTAFSSFEQGSYAIGLPNGTYLVRVHPFSGAAVSWHSAANDCGTATAITVTGVGTHNLVAARGAVVTGTISSSAGPVKQGWVDFYTDCQAYAKNDQVATEGLSKGVYTVNLLPGTYRVQMHPAAGTGGRESWHAAKPTCETADVLTITGDATVDLVAMPKHAPENPPPAQPVPPAAPGPPAGPPALAGQTVKSPPKKVKKGKKITLAKRTAQGTKIIWKSKTKKVCTVKKNVLKAKKKGVCKISAKAVATPAFRAFSKRYTIRVR